MKIPNSNYIKSKREAKSKAESIFEEYKSLLSDKTHPDNQTEAFKKNVVSVLNRLLVCADEMDDQNPGEGKRGADPKESSGPGEKRDAEEPRCIESSSSGGAAATLRSARAAPTGGGGADASASFLRRCASS